MFKLHLRHKNLLLFVLGVGVAVWLSQNADFGRKIGELGHLGSLGYLGAVIAGGMFASTFTVALGAVILFELAKSLAVIPLIFLASLGAVLVDLLIFKFVEDEVDAEIMPIYDKITGSHLHKILHTRFFGWTLPVLGALIIVSPLPDELGISLLGLEEIKTGKFLLISWLSHTLGMTTLIMAAKLI